MENHKLHNARRAFQLARLHFGTIMRAHTMQYLKFEDQIRSSLILFGAPVYEEWFKSLGFPCVLALAYSECDGTPLNFFLKTLQHGAFTYLAPNPAISHATNNMLAMSLMGSQIPWPEGRIDPGLLKSQMSAIGGFFFSMMTGNTPLNAYISIFQGAGVFLAFKFLENVLKMFRHLEANPGMHVAASFLKPILLLVIGLLALLRLSIGSYKTFTPDRTTRPVNPRPVAPGPGAMVAPGAPVRNPVDMYPDLYPPAAQEEVQKLLEQHAELLEEARFPRQILCKCGFTFQVCQCVNAAGAPLVNERVTTEFHKVVKEERAMVRRLRVLRGDFDRKGSLNVGDEIIVRSAANSAVRALSYVFDIDQPFEVVHHFYGADTRPHTDQHIPVSNTRFYVFRKKAPRLIINLFGRSWRYYLPDSLNYIENYPHRDLVIAEEHFRLLRRGTFEDFEKTMRAQLENTVSIPINDPQIRIHGINPLKDAYLLNLGINDLLVPYPKDF